MLQHRDNHSVTCSDVVQQKIRIWVEGFPSKRFGNGIGVSVDLCACRCRGQCAHMALCTANFVTQLGSFLGLLGVRQLRVASGALEARMKRAKWSTSSKPSGPASSLGSVAELQSLVTS